MRSSREPIAIVGIGCRLPGQASDTGSFWDNLCAGRDSIVEVPPERWDQARFFDPDQDAPGKTYLQHGGFVEDIDRFDAAFFGISPREATRMDPQQRMLLEVAWEALEDGGEPPSSLAGTATAVFVGAMFPDYLSLQTTSENRDTLNAYNGVGGGFSILANRVSYSLDLRGPSMTVDTACSSSLVAIHLACQSLWSGESVVALAGGVNALLRPETTMILSHATMVSRTGRCHSFDARADGYVRAEGAGLVVLKPLSAARRDGNPIYATILATDTNQDGRTNGLTVPSGDAQAALLRTVYREAGVHPEQVVFVEAHGTGTPVGDPIEMRAIGSVLGGTRPNGAALAVGSVKSNVGHLESAAGVVGLIKAALVLRHGRIPPNLHFETPNPAIPFNELGVRVPTHIEDLPEADSSPRVVGVNSFGFGGTNAHVVLAEHEAPQPERPAADDDRRDELLAISARAPEALDEVVRRCLDLLTGEQADAHGLRDVCRSAALRKDHHPHRLAVVASSRELLTERLQAYLDPARSADLMSGRTATGGPQGIGFVFSGMGPQWWGMGRELLAEEPRFRDVILECDEWLRSHGGWSLLGEFEATEARSRMTLTEVAQPANFALQVGLARLLESWGVCPTAIVGHSIGEVAAAHVAGALSLEDGLAVSYHRSRLQQRTAGLGTLLAVGRSEQELASLLTAHAGRVSIAAINGPNSVTLSGERASLEAIEERMNEEQAFSRFLRVDVPYHSPLMEPLRDEFLESVASIRPGPNRIPLLSPVTGREVEGESLGADFWWRNLRDPVRFSETMLGFAERDIDTFVEIGPHPVLAASIVDCVAAGGRSATCLSSLRRDRPERSSLLSSLGRLYVLGHPVEWKGVFGEGGRFVRLPGYPWQREAFWNESDQSRADRFGTGSSIGSVPMAEPAHPLLGRRLSSSGQERTWIGVLDVGKQGHLSHHRVHGAALFPAAGFLELGLGAAREGGGGAPFTIEEMSFDKALSLEAGPKTIQFVLDPDIGRFDIHSAEDSKASTWTRQASGRLRDLPGLSAPARVPLEDVRRRCPQSLSGPDIYAHVERFGFQYGPSYQGLVQVWWNDDEALGEIVVPPDVAADATGYLLHPAILDACIQMMILTFPDRRTYVPRHIARFQVHALPQVGGGEQGPVRLWSHVTVASHDRRDHVTNIQVCDASGSVLVTFDQLRGTAIEAAPRRGDELFHEYRWHPGEAPPTVSRPSREPAIWLVFAGETPVGAHLAKEIEGIDERSILIEPGQMFERRDERRFTIRPEIRSDLDRVIAEALPDASPCAGIVHLWSLEDPASTDLESAQALGCTSVLHLVQAMADAEVRPEQGLTLVTRAAAAVSSDDRIAVLQAPLWGLARVIGNEHPELGLRIVDLDPEAPQGEAEILHRELWSLAVEDEVAYRSDARFVHRLEARILGGVETGGSTQSSERFEIAVGRPGDFSSLAHYSLPRRTPGPGQVEIRVHAASLNFKDVVKALGVLPASVLRGTFSGADLGLECAGRITAVGEGVSSFHPGDEVLAFAPRSIATHAITDVRLVAHKPASLSFEEAAGLPVVFGTALYGLIELARLASGERVLIHAATGGVGLAAIQVARVVGAEIFATAGSDEKRAYLRDLGITYVGDSRSTRFAEEVRACTGGEGVDVVLNSLTGEAIAKNLSCLRPYGRLLELGKVDIADNRSVGLLPFQDNLSFFAVDFDRLLRERPEVPGELLRETVGRLEAGALKPLPTETYLPDEAERAFRTLASARHRGKLVIDFQGVAPVRARPREDAPLVHRDGTYVVTGGLTGLGLSVVRWLAGQGAGNVLVLSRRGRATSTEAEDAIRQIGAAGTRVELRSVDVADYDSLGRVLEQSAIDLPPLLGIVHGAAVYDDDLLVRLDPTRFWRVMSPKAVGAWNLHRLTQDHPLDFFVCLSSGSGVLGNPGQGSYAAASTFLDALAHHRRAQGLCSLTVDLGPIADHGAVAESADLEARFRHIGIEAIPTREALDALGTLLRQGAIQTTVARLNWPRWTALHPSGASNRLSHLGRTGADGRPGSGQEHDLAAALHATGAAELEPLVRDRLYIELAEVLGTSPELIDVERSFASLGMDSLMAVEFVTRLSSNLATNIAPTMLWSYPTVDTLVLALVREATSAAGLHDAETDPGVSPDAGQVGNGGRRAPSAAPTATDYDTPPRAHTTKRRSTTTEAPAILPIQTGGDRPPFFLVTAGYGDVFAFSDLARDMGPQQPFYLLQPPRHNASVSTLDALVDRYIEEVRAVQPVGPFYLGGYSLGGLVAYEVCQRLHRPEEEVAVLVLLDTPIHYRHSSAKVYQRLRAVAGRFLRGSSDSRSRFARIARAMFVDEGLDAHNRALAGYTPTPYSGRVALFQARWAPHRLLYRAGLWRRIATGGFECHVVPGDHDSFIRAPHGPGLAVRLRECLERA